MLLVQYSSNPTKSHVELLFSQPICPFKPYDVDSPERYGCSEVTFRSGIKYHIYKRAHPVQAIFSSRNEEIIDHVPVHSSHQAFVCCPLKLLLSSLTAIMTHGRLL